MARGPGASPAWERVVRYFDDREWEIQPVADGRGVNWAFRGEHGEWYGQTWWFDATEQLLVYSICPLPIPESTRAAVAGLVLMINSELAVGCLEFDSGSGHLRCRTGVAVGADDLADSLIDRTVRSNVMTLDRYLPALVRTAAGVPAAQALRDTTGAEVDTRPRSNFAAKTAVTHAAGPTANAT